MFFNKRILTRNLAKTQSLRTYIVAFKLNMMIKHLLSNLKNGIFITKLYVPI